MSSYLRDTTLAILKNRNFLREFIESNVTKKLIPKGLGSVWVHGWIITSCIYDPIRHGDIPHVLFHSELKGSISQYSIYES